MALDLIANLVCVLSARLSIISNFKNLPFQERVFFKFVYMRI